jgi:hypothetical protein
VKSGIYNVESVRIRRIEEPSAAAAAAALASFLCFASDNFLMKLEDEEL